MKKALIISLLILGIVLLDNCSDDPNKPVVNNNEGSILTDYQINIHNDTLWLYDGNRLVGQSIGKTYNVDSLILKDNQ